MLVLSRKPGEKVFIGDDITLTVVRIGPNSARIGIEAPPHVNIRREELDGDSVVPAILNTDPLDDMTVMGQPLWNSTGEESIPIASFSA